MNNRSIDDEIEERIQDARMNGCGQRHIDEIKSLIGKRLLGKIEKLKMTHTLAIKKSTPVEYARYDEVIKAIKDVLNIEGE